MGKKMRDITDRVTQAPDLEGKLKAFDYMVRDNGASVIEEGKIMKGCKTCAKFNKRSGECSVMTELIDNCWAWTNDKGWDKAVKKAVKQYREIRG